MFAFHPTGAILSFTSAASAPTSVQTPSKDGTNSPQVCITNADSANDAVIGWGQSDAEAKANAAAAAGSPNSYYILHGTQVVLSIAPGAFITGIAVANTAVIKVQTGYGV